MTPAEMQIAIGQEADKLTKVLDKVVPATTLSQVTDIVHEARVIVARLKNLETTPVAPK